MESSAAEDLRWVGEGRLLQLVGVARSTLNSWERERLVELPEKGVFSERDVLEILLVAVLRELFPLAEARSLWRNLRRNGTVEEYLELARAVTGARDSLDLIVEPNTGRVTFASTSRAVLEAVRDDRRARTVHVMPLADRIRDARVGFDSFSTTGPVPAVRRGRPPAKRAAVSSIRPEP